MEGKSLIIVFNDAVVAWVRMISLPQSVCQAGESFAEYEELHY